jgi:hypothetical protein
MSPPAEGNELASARGEAKERSSRPRASEGADTDYLRGTLTARRRPKAASAGEAPVRTARLFELSRLCGRSR